MDEIVQTIRGEMQRIGRGLQAGTAGIKAMARSETRAVELIMAVPHAGADKLRGSVDYVGPVVEDKVIRETCWARVVTEEVTVTEREKLSGVTETCTARHVEATERIKEII